MKECNDAHDCQRTQCDLNFDDINEAMERRKRSIAASNGKLYLNCSGQLSCPYLMFLFFWRGCTVSFRISCYAQPIVSGVFNADRVFWGRQNASALFEIDDRWDIGHLANRWIPRASNGCANDPKSRCGYGGPSVSAPSHANELYRKDSQLMSQPPHEGSARGDAGVSA